MHKFLRFCVMMIQYNSTIQYMRFRSMFHKIFIPLVVFPALSLVLPLYEIFRLAVSAWRSEEDMDGKVVFITGAASGIGEQIAYEYAKRKARLVLVDINDDRLQQVSSRALTTGSPDVVSLKADVSNLEDSNHFIQKAVQHFGRLDHLVNNAGSPGAFFGFFQNLDDPHLLQPAMETNFWGSVYSTHYAIPHLKKSKGRIIAIASAIGHIPFPKTTIYNASKAALISFYETLRVEMGSDIGITIVTPGLIDTPLIRGDYMSRMGNLKNLASTSAAECARQIVKSGCRGDAYLSVPYWIGASLLLKALFPELTLWLVRRFFFQEQTAILKERTQ